ncbi:MAG: acyl-CoA thioesterase [Flavobacteriaceae bacterium]|nr:acyl-CoA thioesterase [Flavobacteriaceae bacterium]
MEKFKIEKTVDKDDLDDLDHVNNVRYVQWIQDIAKAHWESKADEALKTRFFWVVSEHHIKYKSPAKLNDDIVIKTYVTKAEGVTSARVVEMHNKATDELILKAETIWVLMDMFFKRPTRITREIAAMFT